MTLKEKLTKNDLEINVFNRQQKVPVDLSSLEVFARRAAQRLRLDSGFSIALVSDAAIRRCNYRFRGKNESTDILSFPGGKEEWEKETASYLGDIVISVETADRQKRHGLSEELMILCLHGILHLLGYDHETDSGEMVRLEAGLKKEFQLP